jgi:hypothetical protein
MSASESKEPNLHLLFLKFSFGLDEGIIVPGEGGESLLGQMNDVSTDTESITLQ